MTEPTTPTPEALALATAARIAHAMDPDGWARCRRTEFDGVCTFRCALHRGHAPDDCVGEHGIMWGDNGDSLPPTLAAAQAEWAAAGGDPERGPALSGRSADGKVEWSVDGRHAPRVLIRVGDEAGIERWSHWEPGRWAPTNDLQAPLADWRECVRLAEAADGGAK